MKRLLTKYSSIIGALIYGIALFLLLYKIVFIQNIDTDIQAHASFVKTTISENVFFSNFIFVFLTRLFSLYSHNYNHILLGLVILISTAGAFKFYIVRTIINSKQIFSIGVIFLTFLILLYYPFFGNIFNQSFFYGLLRPNIYHNSTMLIVLPFVLVLHIMALKIINLNKISTTELVFSSVLFIAIAFIKVSYLLTLFPTFVLFYFWKILKDKIRVNISVIIFIGLIFISISSTFLLVYIFNVNNKITGHNSQLIFAPMQYWNQNTNNLLKTIVLSLSYPVVYLFLNVKKFKQLEINFALITFIISLLISICLCETGHFFNHGNLTWQVHICAFILIVYCVKHNVNSISNIESLMKYNIIIPLVFLVIHAFMGIKYIKWILVVNSYC